MLIKHRYSYLFLEKGRIEVINSSLVFVSEDRGEIQVPVSSFCCLFLEPGTSITHAAIKCCAEAGCLIIWVGESATRVYSAGMPHTNHSDKIILQSKLFLDAGSRLKVVREMFKRTFKEEAPDNRSVEQIRGIEGGKVKGKYKEIAGKYGINWNTRINSGEWGSIDPINRGISVGNSCLYGVAEAAIISSGYSTAIGFMHAGNQKSFVYDVADIYKFDTVVPMVFELIKESPEDIERRTRHNCRDVFKKENILGRIVQDIEDILNGGNNSQ